MTSVTSVNKLLRCEDFGGLDLQVWGCRPAVCDPRHLWL